jgi:hypothetical protein
MISTAVFYAPRNLEIWSDGPERTEWVSERLNSRSRETYRARIQQSLETDQQQT